MAIRVRALLRKWFDRGAYPTAEQFSDFFDSFIHKTEDKIPINNVENLAGSLNAKYGLADGKELEQRVEKVASDLDTHEAAAAQEFDNIQNDLEQLDSRIESEVNRSTAEDQRLDKAIKAETTRATAEEKAIHEDMAAGDVATLQSAKNHTNTAVATEQVARESGDRTTLEAAKAYADKAVDGEEARATAEAAAIRKELSAGDVATLQSAKNHTNTAVATEQVARESGDRTTLEAAKAHANKAVADLVSGSPAALDTLRELSTALGNDPNFATTVATQIGSKVDKVAGKGLSAEDYTTTEKAKLAGVAAGANNYTHPAAHPASVITPDATHRFVTDSEKAAWGAKAEKTAATTSAAGLMSATDKSKLDGVAAGANNYTHPAAHPASVITPDATHRFVTDSEKIAWNAKAEKTAATTSAAGLMSATDKSKLDGVATGANNYTHPVAHPASVITPDATHRFVTDSEKAAWNKNTTSIPALQFKVSNGVLMVKPSVELTDPILDRCVVGILRYKFARARTRTNKDGVRTNRPENSGYKIMDDQYADGGGSSPIWTNVRIYPRAFDAPEAEQNSGWMRLISAADLFHRFVEEESNTSYCGGVNYTIHTGRSRVSQDFGQDTSGKYRQKATVYCGVVLFVLEEHKRYEGPRTFFKVYARNYNNPSAISIK